MRLTVCELKHERAGLREEWDRLVGHARENGSDLVLLPEMIFCPWFAKDRTFHPDVWQSALDAHDAWMERLTELAPAAVLGSRPVERDGGRFNEAFVWREEEGYRAAHTKAYLPNEDLFWEASWYEPGTDSFEAADCGRARIGFAVCTDIWFFRHAREYAGQGVHLIAHPRATMRVNLDKWLLAGRAAAVVAGAYCISSNHVNSVDTPPECGGMGYVVDPEGEVLGRTSEEAPFLTLEVDLGLAEIAKASYPRYVKDPYRRTEGR